MRSEWDLEICGWKRRDPADGKFEQILRLGDAEGLNSPRMVDEGQSRATEAEARQLGWHISKSLDDQTWEFEL